MLKATIKDRTLEQALARADKVEQELPKVIQVVPSDWDIVILAKEVRRLKKLIAKQKTRTDSSEDYCVRNQNQVIDEIIPDQSWS